MAVFANVSAVRAVVDISSAMGVAATRSGDSGCERWATSFTTAPSSTVFGENTPPPHGEACSAHISVSPSAVSIAITSGSGGFGGGSWVNRRDNPSLGRSGRLGGAGISGAGGGGFGGRSLAGFIGTPRPRTTASPSPSHWSRAGCCCKSSFPFAFPSMHNTTVIASASDSFSPTSFSTVVVASRTSPGFGGGGGPCGFPRDMVVRCELAATGSAGDSYSLSEPKMESKVRGACFYAVTAFGAIILFVLMLVGHPFVLMFDRHRRKFQHFVAKVWAALTVAPFYKIKFEGLENLPPPDTPAVYVSNHQSFLDIYTLLTLGRGFKFISKTQIFLFPIIGWAMFLLGTIPLKRMDSRSQLDCLKRCMDLIKKGASVFFFPEGTRSKDGKLGAFKKGAFSVAVKTKAPVVPITLIGTGQIMPPGREGIVNFGSVKVVIHKPIDGNDPDILCKEARKMIASVLTQS